LHKQHHRCKNASTIDASVLHKQMHLSVIQVST
jgi:hypothetical protein